MYDTPTFQPKSATINEIQKFTEYRFSFYKI